VLRAIPVTLSGALPFYHCVYHHGGLPSITSSAYQPGIGGGQAGGSTLGRMHQFCGWIGGLSSTSVKFLWDRTVPEAGGTASRPNQRAGGADIAFHECKIMNACFFGKHFAPFCRGTPRGALGQGKPSPYKTCLVAAPPRWVHFQSAIVHFSAK
jgi:hypothetical protein